MVAHPRSRAARPRGRWRLDRGAEPVFLLEEPLPQTYPQFLEDLRICAARVVALSDVADLVIVGRSPESLHHYLDGLTTGAGRLAWHIERIAATREERVAFVRILTQQPQFRSARVRALASALR